MSDKGAATATPEHLAASTKSPIVDALANVFPDDFGTDDPATNMPTGVSPVQQAAKGLAEHHKADAEIEGEPDSEPDDEDAAALRKLAEELDQLKPEMDKAVSEGCTAEAAQFMKEWYEEAREKIDEGEVGDAEERIQGLRDEIEKAGKLNLSGSIAQLAIPEKENFGCWVLDPEIMERFDFNPRDPANKLAIDAFREAVLPAFEAKSEDRPKLPALKIGNCEFECSKPMITLSNPKVTGVQRGLTAHFGSSFKTSGKYVSGGLFGVYVTVMVTCPQDSGEWTASLVQNCSSNRAVKYSDGSSITTMFGMVLDKTSAAQSLTPGKRTVLHLTDAPAWEIPDREGAVATATASDAFIVYLMISGSGKPPCCLYKMTWTFTCNGTSAKYEVKSLEQLDGSSDAGVITGGAKANSHGAVVNESKGKGKV